MGAQLHDATSERHFPHVLLGFRSYHDQGGQNAQFPAGTFGSGALI
jgi:hypothetical protein